MKKSTWFLCVVLFCVGFCTTAAAQQLPSQRPAKELLGSRVKEELQRSGPPSQGAGAPQTLPSAEKQIQKRYYRPPAGAPVAGIDKQKQLPSSRKKGTRHPVRRPARPR